MSQYAGKKKKRFCAGQSYSQQMAGGWSSCANGGKHEEAGKWWCGHHLPSKVKAKQQARHRKWKKESDERQARYSHNVRVSLAEGVLVREALARKINQDDLPDWLDPLVEDVGKARAGA